MELYQGHTMKGKELRAIRDKLDWTQVQMARFGSDAEHGRPVGAR